MKSWLYSIKLGRVFISKVYICQNLLYLVHSCLHMPIIKSAKKALRGSEKKRVYNIRRQKKVEVAIKDIKKLITEKKVKDATAALSLAYKALDKAAKAGTIKKGAADRKKSRLAAFIKKNA